MRELLRLVVSAPPESVVALSELKRIADFVNLKLCHALLDSTSGKLQELPPLAISFPRLCL